MVFPYCRGFLYSRQDGVPWAVSYPPCLEGLRGQLPVLESQAGGNGCVFITSAPRLVWTVLNPVFVLALVLGLYVLALGRMPNLRRECGAWTWLFALSMFVSAGVTVYYVCLTRAGSMNYVWTGCLIVWFMNIYRTRWGKRITSPQWGLSSGCLIYGIFCGACNEGATIGMAAAFCIMAAVGMLRDRRVGAYVWCGFAGVALGGLFLFAAPGLYSRLGHDLGASEVLRKGGFCAYAESFGILLYYHARMLCKIYAVSAVLTGFLLFSGTERCREVIRKEKESFFYILFYCCWGASCPFVIFRCAFPPIMFSSCRPCPFWRRQPCCSPYCTGMRSWCADCAR